MKIIFVSFLFFIFLEGGFCLPDIPGCPLHESCVQALKREQRRSQRELRRRENPEAPMNQGELVGTSEGGAVKKTLGIILGFQLDAGDFNDKKNDYINLRPSLSYLKVFGGLDIFLSAFYSLSLDDPGLSPAGKDEKLETLNRCGFEAGAAYVFDFGDSFILDLELSNRNLFDMSSGDSSYAVLEPSFRIAYVFVFGELNAGCGFPFAYAGDMALDYTVSVGFSAAPGFGLDLSSRFWNVWVERDSEYGRTNPGFQYGETELLLNYWRGPFFASLILTADGPFRQFSVEPYLSYRFKTITFFTGLLFNNLGAEGDMDKIRLNQIQGKRDISGVIPSIGIKLQI
jgi:hypothetical protein